jgi:hypothetical protein
MNQCCQCQSTDLSACSMIYSQQSKRSVHFDSNSRTSSLLADSIAPPRKPRFVGFIFLLSLIFGFWIISIAPLLLQVALFRTANLPLTYFTGMFLGVLLYWLFFYRGWYRKYLLKLVVWQKQWICLRCGNLWLAE